VLSRNNYYVNASKSIDEDSSEEGLDVFYQSIENIRNHIESLRKHVYQLKDLYENVIGVGYKNAKSTEREINGLIETINSKALTLRHHLDLLKSTGLQAEDEVQTHTEQRIEKNIYDSLLQEFLDLMQEYESIQSNHNQQVHRIVQAQIHLVDPKATDETIQKAVKGGSKMIFASEKTKLAYESLNYVKSKQVEIEKLERSLEEVYHLFQDMADSSRTE